MVGQITLLAMEIINESEEQKETQAFSAFLSNTEEETVYAEIIALSTRQYT